jgi:DNA (cytosine-5)-methyltransferase 1
MAQTENKKLNIYWIDLFSGAGGTSTGIHLAGQKVVACVNHDADAIAAHKENHPETIHLMEDVRDLNVVYKLEKIVNEIRIKDPFAVISIWASLECTNFSIAKGGQPRDADSRTLANSMFSYLSILTPEYFWVENVKEFRSWGPLDENGKPINKNAGSDYMAWMNQIRDFGFKSDEKILNAADFGSCQSRKRLFIQFPKQNLPYCWPEQTHSKDGGEEGLFPIFKWRSVKEVIDFEDEGKSIFERKKELSPNTLDVIAKGIIKAMKEREKTFLFKYYGNGDNYNSINVPAGTVTTKDRFAKITMIFNQYKTGFFTSIEQPCGSLTTNPKQNLVTFLLNPSHGGHTTSINQPSPTIIARQDKAPLYLIKALMSDYEIIDIKMRMLKISELLQIQGFPIDYRLKGNQKEQKKQIGNAVDVYQSIAIAKAFQSGLNNYFQCKN